MIKISICDDEQIFSNIIYQKTKNFFDKKQINVSITCFNKSTSLAESLTTECDLYILDIMMPESSGLELASLIRNTWPDSCIIFVSSMADAVFSSFSVSPLRFIRKELIDEELNEALMAFLSEVNASEQILQIPDDGNIIALPIKSVCFAETDKHYINFYTEKAKYTIRGKLSTYEEQFSYENIFRISQSYMVNLRFIRYYEVNAIVLKNDMRFNIGRKYKEVFKENFFKYQRKYYHENFL